VFSQFYYQKLIGQKKYLVFQCFIEGVWLALLPFRYLSFLSDEGYDVNINHGNLAFQPVQV
jgi:hypothetical protein